MRQKEIIIIEKNNLELYFGSGAFYDAVLKSHIPHHYTCFVKHSCLYPRPSPPPLLTVGSIARENPIRRLTFLPTGGKLTEGKINK